MVGDFWEIVFSDITGQMHICACRDCGRTQRNYLWERALIIEQVYGILLPNNSKQRNIFLQLGVLFGSIYYIICLAPPTLIVWQLHLNSFYICTYFRKYLEY